jgi:integrase/recombinase XerD
MRSSSLPTDVEVRAAGVVIGGGGERGELVSDSPLLAAALEVAGDQPANTTRATYARTYRALDAFLTMRVGGRPAVPEDLDRRAMQAFRDALERSGRRPATISKDLSAVRTLARRLELDPAVVQVKSVKTQRSLPKPMSRHEYEAILRTPDTRSAPGRRDVVIMLLMGDAGLRRSEVCALTLADLDAYQRHPDPRRRDAISDASVNRVVRVRDSKRGNNREIDLSPRLSDALDAWLADRQHIVADTDRVFVSLPRSGISGPMRPRAVNALVARHGRRAKIEPGLCTPHKLRHTFCTLLHEDEVAIELIRDLAGHADIRTTTQYVKTSRERARDAIRSTFGETEPAKGPRRPFPSPGSVR